MIVNFNLYESRNKYPNEGDWVICYEVGGTDIFNKLLSNNVGRVFKKNFNVGREVFDYLVIFPGINLEEVRDIKIDSINRLGDILNYCHYSLGRDDVVKYGICNRVFMKNEIMYWSKNKSDLEAIIAAKKFNV